MEWSEVEPVLKATYRLLENQESVTQDQVCQALGRPPGDDRTVRALGLLYTDALIGGLTNDQSNAPLIIETTAKGLRQASGWPRDGNGAAAQVELFLRLLDERIESDQTPDDEKGRLRRVRDAIADLGRDVAVGVLSANISRATRASGDGS